VPRFGGGDCGGEEGRFISEESVKVEIEPGPSSGFFGGGAKETRCSPPLSGGLKSEGSRMEEDFLGDISRKDSWGS
jgi:hypothetical protein